MLGNFCWALEICLDKGKFWSFAFGRRGEFRDVRGRGGVQEALHEDSRWENLVFPDFLNSDFKGRWALFHGGEFVHRAWTPVFGVFWMAIWGRQEVPHVDVEKSCMNLLCTFVFSISVMNNSKWTLTESEVPHGRL